MGERRTSKVTGRDALIKRMKRQFGTRMVSAQVGQHATKGKRSRGGKGFKVFTDKDGKKTSMYRSSIEYPSRTAGENITILRFHMKHGRNPVHATKIENADIQKMWLRAINKFMEGDKGALEHGAKKIGAYIVQAIKNHIEHGKHIRGKMRRLAPLYAMEKELRWGEKPILEASGQLIKSLYSDFKLIKG